MIRAVHWFFAPTRRFGWGPIMLAGALAGIVFWGGFNTFMEYTNRLEFCVSCHEMDQLVYREYQKTIHFKNRSGVRVSCADCHVPKDWMAKLWRKIEATNELYHKLAGTIDTPEKFNAKRLELAEHVWDSMRANDSRECRNCHSYEAMDFHKQRKRGRKKMEAAMKEGKTCIECHKGIAHRLPDEFVDDD